MENIIHFAKISTHQKKIYFVNKEFENRGEPILQMETWEHNNSDFTYQKIESKPFDCDSISWEDFQRISLTENEVKSLPYETRKAIYLGNEVIQDFVSKGKVGMGFYYQRLKYLSFFESLLKSYE